MTEQDDLSALAEIAAQHSRTIMARSGQLPLASYIMTPDGVQMLVAGATDELNKRMFAAITRVCGAKHDATATAVVMESWTVTPRTDEEKRQYREVKARGGSFAELDCAVEKVIIVTGDGVRQDVREYMIVRHHQEMVEMRLADTMMLEGERRLAGMMVDLHARPDERDSDGFREMMEIFDGMGLLKGVSVSDVQTVGRSN